MLDRHWPGATKIAGVTCEKAQCISHSQDGILANIARQTKGDPACCKPPDLPLFFSASNPFFWGLIFASSMANIVPSGLQPYTKLTRLFPRAEPCSVRQLSTSMFMLWIRFLFVLAMRGPSSIWYWRKEDAHPCCTPYSRRARGR